jgi:two-component system response regulator WspF
VRIGIVNDRPLAVEALKRAVALRSEHHVIWVAKHGGEAVELCAKATPHLVLMDLIMPQMDGVEATRRIMASTPCAILIVTASVGANSRRAYEAMGHGALDAVDTPGLGSADPQQSAAPLLTKIETIGRMLNDKRRLGHLEGHRHTRRRGTAVDRLIAIGASAGGPAALATVLRGLPKDFPAAIVVIQHVDERFAAGMATWLGQQTALTVRVAVEGDRLTPGTVLLAGTNNHLVFKGADRVGYEVEPSEYSYRPSVDVFFQSVSHHWPGEAIGVLLTGMGRDGAVGLRALRNQGHHTIAQDEASSVVYGMPKAAAKLQAAVDILSVDRIAPQLVEIVTCAK